MSKLFSLIIGINDYPIPQHRLQGCVPDATAMHEFLAGVCAQQDLDYKPLLLLNEQACRKPIINSFAHFGPAEDGDICVLYYSGHGSQMHSPREFWSIDTDRMLETIVCFDSRLRGGRDLTDKELSYLIWKYTKKTNKDIHFLSIFDCCHSGTITRGTAERPAGGLTSRMADKNPTRFDFSVLEGHREYTRREDGAVVPPLGNYITLSAAQSDESAYEMNIGGKPRGIFTNALLDVLNRTNLQYITYAELLSRVHTRVQNLTNAQTPQHPLSNAYGTGSTRHLFLNGKMSKSPRSYAKYDQKEGWILDLGEMHGVRRGARLQLDVNGQTIGAQVRTAGPGRSLIEPDGHLDKRVGEYLIKQIDLKAATLPIDINPGLNDPKLVAKIEAAVKDSDKLALDQATVKYWINLDPDRGYVLTRPGEEMPVFKGVRTDVQGDPAAIFIDNVEKVAFWEYVSELSNPLANVRVETWLDIELVEVLEHSDYTDVIKAETKSLDEEAIFSYQYRHGQWLEPALQLRVKNIGNRDLWIAGLYLSEDFSITDVFMPVRQIRPGEEPYRFTDENGNEIIALWLPDEIYSWGGTEIINKIKVIASSEPFKVEDLCQDGLELEHRDLPAEGVTRGARPSRNTPQWVTKDIQLRIVRPLDAQPLAAGRGLSLHNLTIEGHESFSAGGVSLATSAEAARSVGHAQPQFGLPQFTDINLATRRDVGKPLDVIELNDVSGAENISADRPLKLRLGAGLSDGSTVIPFGLDESTGLYFPLGYTDADGTVRIEQMPDPEDGRSRGFLKSCKIYLKGVWFDKVLKTEADTSVLAVAEVKDELSDAVYLTDPAVVRDRVKDARRILVLIHGWMGDTRDKVKVVQRARRTADGREETLADRYDLLLTFDYNSLGQPVEQSARQLKAQLEAAGLTPDDGKTVHLLTHSAGGLVARWMLEQEGGEGLVDHLVLIGCPNLGTPWARAYDFAVLGLGKLINFLPIPGTVSEVLGFLGTLRESMDEALAQLQGGSPLIEQLKANAAPIPYTVIAGDTSRISQRDDREEKLLRRYLDRFQGAYRKSLETALFGEVNDDVVSLQSMQAVQGGKLHKPDPVGTSHVTYFASEEGVQAIGEVLFRLP